MSDHTTDMLYARGYDQAKRGEFGAAATLYGHSRRHRRQGRFLSTGSRDSHRLLDLSEIEDTCHVDTRSYVGLRTVPIEQIRGSQGRSNDFDRDFHPLQDHSRWRWLRVARARDQNKVLPPVELVQVGDVYFVCDGHHRISVACALGQLDIEAEVTVWQVSGPLPWDAREQPSRPGLADRIRGMGRAIGRRRLRGLAGSSPAPAGSDGAQDGSHHGPDLTASWVGALPSTGSSL